MTMTSKNILLKVLFKIKIGSIVNETIMYTLFLLTNQNALAKWNKNIYLVIVVSVYSSSKDLQYDYDQNIGLFVF